MENVQPALQRAFCVNVSRLCFIRASARVRCVHAPQEWLACVHEVMPGICVFCGMNPATVENSDEQSAPQCRLL